MSVHVCVCVCACLRVRAFVYTFIHQEIGFKLELFGLGFLGSGLHLACIYIRVCIHVFALVCACARIHIHLSRYSTLNAKSVKDPVKRNTANK